MNSKDTVPWVMYVCSSLRLSQAKTLSQLVAAAGKMARTSLAELGRCLSTNTRVATKHCIKRVDRFVGNHRIEPTTAMQGVIRWLALPRKKLLVSLDWVDIRSLHCLVLAARIRGRALPLLWAVYRSEQLYRSQNYLEYGLLQLFRTMIPSSTQVVILADRGFGRAEMARQCQKMGFDYIIRIRPEVYICHPDFTGKLLDLPLELGYSKVFRNVAYRQNRPVNQHVAVLWPRCQSEPWFLMTNLGRIQAAKLGQIFSRRMSIEQYFRDAKSKRNGFALRLSMIGDPRRLERLLLVLALAYILLVAVGLHCLKRYRPSRWCSNNRVGECSLFTIGRVMLDQPLPKLKRLLKDLRREVLLGNWG